MPRFNKQTNAGAEIESLDFRAILGTEEGKRVFAYILSRCGSMEMLTPSVDTHYTAFQAGKEYVGKWIIGNIIKHMPDKLGEILSNGGKEYGYGKQQRDTDEQQP